MRTVRAERLDWTLIWNDRHLRQVLIAYLVHYNTGRPHRGINLDVPMPSPNSAGLPSEPIGHIERVDVLGGLIHEYQRAA